MWPFLANLLGGPLVQAIVGAYKAKLEATNTSDRIAADVAMKDIDAQIAARAEATKVLVAEQGRWYTAAIRPLFALPFILYVNKVVVWDKILGWGSTDPLSGDIAVWGGYVVIAFFGGRPIEKAARALAGTISNRMSARRDG